MGSMVDKSSCMNCAQKKQQVSRNNISSIWLNKMTTIDAVNILKRKKGFCCNLIII